MRIEAIGLWSSGPEIGQQKAQFQRSEWDKGHHELSQPQGVWEKGRILNGILE